MTSSSAVAARVRLSLAHRFANDAAGDILILGTKKELIIDVSLYYMHFDRDSINWNILCVMELENTFSCHLALQ